MIHVEAVKDVKVWHRRSLSFGRRWSVYRDCLYATSYCNRVRSYFGNRDIDAPNYNKDFSGLEDSHLC